MKLRGCGIVSLQNTKFFNEEYLRVGTRSAYSPFRMVKQGTAHVTRQTIAGRAQALLAW